MSNSNNPNPNHCRPPEDSLQGLAQQQQIVPLIRTAVFCHQLVERLCVLLVIGLVVSQIAIVLLRYIYGIGFLQLQNFSLYCFSALVVLSVVYTYGRNKHVRVDVFREKQRQSTQQWVDIVSLLFFLMPVFSLTLYWVWPDISYAWSIKEGAKETGGLGGLYIVKSALPLSCALLIMQALIAILHRGRHVIQQEVVS